MTLDFETGEALRRIPADLPKLIIERGKHFKRADDREYRVRVAHRAQQLVASLNTEAGKRKANARRASSRRRLAD